MNTQEKRQIPSSRHSVNPSLRQSVTPSIRHSVNPHVSIQLARGLIFLMYDVGDYHWCL